MYQFKSYIAAIKSTTQYVVSSFAFVLGVELESDPDSEVTFVLRVVSDPDSECVVVLEFEIDSDPQSVIDVLTVSLQLSQIMPEIHRWQ